MHKFLLVFVLLITFPLPVQALDLSISNPVISDLEVAVNASLSATSNYYLQGVLRAQSSSKYFGETLNGKGEWIDYVSSPDKEYILSNFFQTDIQNASWSGTVRLRFKLDDPNYLGPGLYDLKLRRFTGNSSGSAGDSNTVSLNLTANVPSPTPSPSPSSSAPQPSSTSSPLPSLKPSPLPSPSLSASDREGTTAGIAADINLEGFGLVSSPLASSAPSPSPALTLNRRRAKSAVILGLGLMLTSLSGYLIYRRYLSLHPDSN